MLVACAAAMLALPSSAAAIAYPSANRLLNSGAEAGLTEWRGSGFVAASYAATGVSRSVSGRDAPELGEQHFVAAGDGAELAQVVDLSPRAEQIDAGRQWLGWGADGLGGRAGRSGGGRVTIQPLDAGGAALGPPASVGPPSDRDRQHRTAMLFCSRSMLAPPGTRSVRVSLQAVGQAIVDDAFLLEDRIRQTGDAWVVPFRVTDAAGCVTSETEPSTPPPATSPASTRRAPALGSLVVLPAAGRCRQPAALRFSVRPAWRSKVERLTVRARGISRSTAGGRAIAIARPRTTLRVSLRVTLRDGRVRTGARRFSARCAAR